eukprot:TRINITY_DN8634_c1_g1_i2.p1 TRINITY_DN8634_c1_g1~~TRINITY_DN8634_c1_g1_i2.p1  ORF type:complete len:1060 (+),score=78.60 TRINITY_DN8634_c1_g1_i2:73-3252(+)
MMLAAAVLIASSSGVQSGIYEPSQASAPFSGAACDPAGWGFVPPCNCSTVIKGLTVSIEDGYVQSTDELACPDCAAKGVGDSWDGLSGVLRMRGAASIDTYMGLLGTVTFKSDSRDENLRRVTWALGTAVYSTATGHWYEFYERGKASSVLSYPNCEAPGHTNCRWDDAQAECSDEQHEILGLLGHLATVTDASEHGILAQLHAEGWIGASDAAKEGTWRWVTGMEGCSPYDTSASRGAARSACNMGFPLAESKDPCSGPQCGQGMHIGNLTSGLWGVSTFNKAYDPQYWHPSEPNDFSSPCPGSCAQTGEDYMYLLANGSWRDFPLRHDDVEGYVCEWGGVGQLCLSEDAVYGTVLLHPSCATITNATVCDNRRFHVSCTWNATQGVCVQPSCSSYSRSECSFNKQCYWNLRSVPPACVDSYCATKWAGHQVGCNSDARNTGVSGWDGPCRWEAAVAAPNQCQPVSCYDIQGRCDCLQMQPVCLWDYTVTDTRGGSCIDSKFASCPAADIVFIFDGSGSMKSSFGAHAIGYMGLMEDLRSWLAEADLAPAPDASHGVSVALIQFSDNTESWRCMDDGSGCSPGGWFPSALESACDNPLPAAPCTNGTFSAHGGGNPAARLDADINWHQENFQSRQTYLKPGLLLAEGLLASTNKTSKRLQIIIVITDGQITDAAGAVNVSKQISMQPDPPTIFGVVLRKTAAHTPADLDAELSMRQLVSGPFDAHFRNVPMDDLTNTILDALCDPSTTLGRVTASPSAVDCARHVNVDNCTTDMFCRWEVGEMKCVNSECTQHCTEAGCAATACCTWNDSARLCGERKTTCAHQISRADCLADDCCVWDREWAAGACSDHPCVRAASEVACEHVNREWSAPCHGRAPDYCRVPTCTWTAGNCSITECLHNDSARCNAEAGCEWRPPTPTPVSDPVRLQVKYCQADCSRHPSAAVCNNGSLLNECNETCPSCAGTTCTAAGQECNDTNTSDASTKDWMCLCPPPSTASAALQPANCTQDECLANGSVCVAQGQLCNDTNLTAAGDWYCECPLPSGPCQLRTGRVRRDLP